MLALLSPLPLYLPLNDVSLSAGYEYNQKIALCLPSQSGFYITPMDFPIKIPGFITNVENPNTLTICYSEIGLFRHTAVNNAALQPFLSCPVLVVRSAEPTPSANKRHCARALFDPHQSL